MTLQQLRYVEEICKCGSISAAAQKLYIAQPSLSKAIHELENELHITIFDRGRRGAALTSDGLEFLDYVKVILRQTENVKARFANKKEPLRLSISVQHYIVAVDAIIEFINHKLESTPDFSIKIRDGNASQVIDDVVSGYSEIGIICISNLNRHLMNRLFQTNDLVFHSFGKFAPHVYLRCGHPLTAHQILTYDLLKPYPYIVYEHGDNPLNVPEESVILEDRSNMKCICVTDRSTSLSIIRNTNAYNIGSGCLLPNIVGSNICTIPLKTTSESMQFGWIKLKNMMLQKEMIEYIHLMEQTICKFSNVQKEFS
ncbi:DNA-binding transcriptional regulator, LysR family [Oscillibacter sp. PC13]|uniref:LysR family transcriptional regulator n=1 Tax=Oscillibacter sp. PC13 TaxID=1855299 RepID=UPI0008EF33EA|nr:LysR family transcriptional regulator [Oscillibacter sp. PC13]SFP77378.1 DNA-binding transcriptional regulator, LysR family [Oscillibacter sp. PC13]